ncbi:hypothetical protein GII33_13970 [Gordonia pseudamarae]|uniref:Helix-turn-helix domain-containing protein n=1 Tax=Gordonia pseudamarae TaxID=2831662 RepID=A0ABX6IIV3_9ACTN|nr:MULTISPECIES: helix-turn-helix domain-containing protein [Gordonia]MBD0024444.1 hypothetical protein [Gordonia sp. (in: high G+C Gram-positive bacteria)]QHN26894.1 hypothetical protein GII33_13970 [Gordonia pseudamarae]QHN35784.1 hypothetical protein GII31_13795 [Gordonia pseudamarae]
MNTEYEAYLTVAELAARLGVRENTIREGVEAGIIPAHPRPMLTAPGTRHGFLWSECVRFVGKPISRAPQLDQDRGAQTGDDSVPSAEEWTALADRLRDAADELRDVLSEIAVSGDRAEAELGRVDDALPRVADHLPDALRTVAEAVAPDFSRLDDLADQVSDAVDAYEQADAADRH